MFDSLCCFMWFMLLCLVEYHALYSSLTYRAEALGNIVAHATNIRRTIDAL